MWRSFKEIWQENLSNLDDYQSIKVKVTLAASTVLLLVYSLAIPIRHSVDPLNALIISMLVLSYALNLASIVFAVKKPRFHYSQYAFLVSLYLVILPAAFFNGGLGAPVFPLVLLLPIGGAFLIGRNGAFLFFMLSLFTLFAIYGAWRLGYLPESSLEMGVKFETARLVILTALLCLSLGLGFFYEATRHKAYENLKKRAVMEKTIAEYEAIRSMIITYNHELNNPLTVVMGHMRHLAKEDNISKDRLDKSLKALNQINHVVKEIGKITESGRFEKDFYTGESTMIKISNFKNTEGS